MEINDFLEILKKSKENHIGVIIEYYNTEKLLEVIETLIKKAKRSDELKWIPIQTGKAPYKFQKCFVMDERGNIFRWVHDDALFPLYFQYAYWMPDPLEVDACIES